MKVFAAIALLCATAHADDLTPRARAFAERGRAMHAAGNYAAAIDAYKSAYVIAPTPGLLFNLAQAYRLEGDCEGAAIMYRRYLAADPEPDARAIAETQLAGVERCARDHAPVPPAPIVAPHAAITATTTADAPHSSLERDAGIGLGIGGALALGGAIYFGVVAAHAAGDVTTAYANGGAGKDVAALDDRGRHAALDAKILGGAGALALAGGIALYVVGSRAEHIEIAPAKGGGRVSVSWAW